MTMEQYLARKAARVKAKQQQTQKENDVAKQIMHVGVALATDGPMPGRDNILNVSACIGDTFTFSQNVTPTDGYKESKLWLKNPEEFAKLKLNPMSLRDTMKAFETWLGQWQGRLVACCSVIDFWHLFTSMMEHTGGCPFGTLPLDAASFYCGSVGTKAPGKITDAVAPQVIAKERWKMVTAGHMPQFGGSPKKKSMPKLERLRAAYGWEAAPPRPTRVRVNAPVEQDWAEPVIGGGGGIQEAINNLQQAGQNMAVPEPPRFNLDNYRLDPFGRLR